MFAMLGLDGFWSWLDHACLVFSASCAILL